MVDAPQIKKEPARNAKADLAVCDAATPGPWYEFCEDDRDCSNVVGVATVPNPDPTDLDDAGKLIAVTLDNGLVTFPVTVADDKWHENAAFISMAREALPYWIRLAQMREAALYQLRSGRSR